MPATALKKNETPRGSAGRPAVRKVQEFPEVQAGSPAAAARAGTAAVRIPPPVLWSIKEIAAHYGVTTTTVHRAIKGGMLPEPEKDFGSRLWDRNAVILRIKKGSSRRP